MAPYVKAINELKKERDAVILAHNYQTPEIFHCVADIVGDSLQLAHRGHQGEGRHHRPVRRALHGRDLEDPEPAQDRADPGSARRLLAGVLITGADVRLLRERFPGVPVVAYVNTSADVKAEVDICCTSSNAVAGGGEPQRADTVIFLPDQYLAKYVASQTKREDHRLEGRLRGARALHRRRAARLSRGRSRRCRSSRIRNARPT